MKSSFRYSLSWLLLSIVSLFFWAVVQVALQRYFNLPDHWLLNALVSILAYLTVVVLAWRAGKRSGGG